MNFYLVCVLAWCVFTGIFSLYNEFTSLPRSRRHMKIAYTWMAWSALMLAFTIYHFQ
jgi:hypothetical protein